MVSNNQFNRTKFLIDYITPLLWEDDDFLSLFCSGCPGAPDVPWDECAAGNDPRCAECWRSDLAESIEQSFRDIAVDMYAWGCGE